ncbi:MAG: UDP-N-acetylmuramoyl-tripeptide--D-alanyl-D-alanine ligase [Pseudomonadota bacterium]
MIQTAQDEPLWRWPELCEALDLPVVDGPDVAGVAIDSRQLKQGELFVALAGDPGSRFTVTHRSERDGHDFIEQAFAAGAAGALVSRDKAPIAAGTGRALLKVADTLDGLWQLGAARRRQLEGPVVAVTGSSGKTTAKAFLAAALDAHATAGSLNNHLGVPLSLGLTPRTARPVVIEIGMNHPGEIAPLAQLARPNVAVVVNVGTAHIENFADPDGIRKEKLSIVEGLSPQGILVVHDEVDLTGIAALPERILRFGRSGSADVRLLALDGLTARYRVGAVECAAAVPGGGWHRAQTLGAALAVLQALAMPVDQGLSLPQHLVPAGRGAIRQIGSATLIDDCYNANPASMAAALEQLLTDPPRSGPCYALLGEMKELGDLSADAHRTVCAQAAGLDGYWLVGDAWPEAAPGNLLGRWPRVDERTAQSLLKNTRINLDEPYNLLIKGSNSVFWQSRFVDKLADGLAAAGLSG